MQRVTPQMKSVKSKKVFYINYNDEIISAPSTGIAIKKEKFHLPTYFFHPKEKKQIKFIIYLKSINKPQDCPYSGHFK